MRAKGNMLRFPVPKIEKRPICAATQRHLALAVMFEEKKGLLNLGNLSYIIGLSTGLYDMIRPWFLYSAFVS